MRGPGEQVACGPNRDLERARWWLLLLIKRHPQRQLTARGPAEGPRSSENPCVTPASLLVPQKVPGGLRYSGRTDSR